MGVYQELIEAIKSFDVELAKRALRFQIAACLSKVPWRFLVALVSGIAISILTLSHLVSWLLANRQVEIYALFFGLVLASVVSVAREVKWSAEATAGLIAGTVLAYWVVGLVPTDMSHDPLTLFLSGSVAISAMILPGISGSFILLILGQYAHVIESVKNLDIITLVPFALGCILGLMIFSRVLSWLFIHHRQLTITLLVGFMLGSLRKIWPFKEVVSTRVDRHGDIVPLLERNLLPDFAATQTWVAIGLTVVGLLLILGLETLRRRMLDAEGEAVSRF
jgi:putative membrane protein